MSRAIACADTPDRRFSPRAVSAAHDRHPPATVERDVVPLRQPHGEPHEHGSDVPFQSRDAFAQHPGRTLGRQDARRVVCADGGLARLAEQRVKPLVALRPLLTTASAAPHSAAFN